MAERLRYRRKAGRGVVAVQLNVDTDGFVYRKWGQNQLGKRGDWLVDNDGDVYTVAAETFAQTYRETGRGTYVKVGLIWAELAREAGSVATKEGRTNYAAGDYVVSNYEDGTDSYAISAVKFADLYELDE
jgi:hypothetical protein